MTHTTLNNHIDDLIHKRDQVLATTPPEYALYFVNYYECVIDQLIDLLVDLDCERFN